MPRGRLALLVAGGVALLVGMWTGLGRAGMGHTGGPAEAHGVIMVLGFLGTLIALERAVASRARWAYVAPSLSGAATFVLVAGGTTEFAGVLLTIAGGVVVSVHSVAVRRHREAHLLLMAAGALLWVVAAGLWTLGQHAARLSPLLAGFLVLTIVGERLELSRLRVPTASARQPLVAAAGLFVIGVATTLVDWSTGVVVAGVGLLAQSAWLAHHDIARVTIRRDGVARYAAACVLAAYVWLGVGGLLWVALGMAVGGPLVLDASLHAVFLGFVMSMVMGHAPIILPAVLRTPLQHRPNAWLPLVILHGSVVARVAADLAGSTWLRGWAAHANVTALLLFVLVSATGVRRARRADHACQTATVGWSASAA